MGRKVISDEAVEAAFSRMPYQAADYIDTDTMREILDAAAPYIAAQVWDEAAASIIDERGNPIAPTNIDNPYRSQA